MRKCFFRLSLICTCAIMTIGVANSQIQEQINPRTTAIPFLRIAADARSSAMGDCGIASTPDASSSFWNLAKTPFAKANTGIGLTYAPWLKNLGVSDVYLMTGSFYTKLNDGQSAIGGGIRYFSLGTLQFTDNNAVIQNTFRPRETAFDFGYARKLSDRLSLGVALRYISSNLTGDYSQGGNTYKAGRTVAGDISLYYDGVTEKNGSGFAWGIALTNLGGKIGYSNDNQNKDYIPANLGFGFNYTYPIDDLNKLHFMFDLNKLLVPAPPTRLDPNSFTTEDSLNLANYRSQSVVSSWGKSFSDGGGFVKSIQISLGAEYSYNDQFFFRAGYFGESNIEGGRKYFTAGAGIQYNTMNFNFSYLIPSGNTAGAGTSPLANTLRFGISFDLDKEETR
jgi:hypothetical protein